MSWVGWVTLALDLLRGKDCAYWDQQLKLTLNSLKEEVFGWMNVMYVCLNVTVQCLVTFWCFSHGFSHFSSEKAINDHLLFLSSVRSESCCDFPHFAAIFRVLPGFSVIQRDFPGNHGWILSYRISVFCEFEMDELKGMSGESFRVHFDCSRCCSRPCLHGYLRHCSQCHSRSFKGFFTQRNPVTTVSWVSICKSYLGSL